MEKINQEELDAIIEKLELADLEESGEISEIPPMDIAKVIIKEAVERTARELKEKRKNPQAI